MSTKSKVKPSEGSRTQQSALFILHYKTRRVLVASPNDYNQLQTSTRRHFPEIPADHRVSYHTDELAISKGGLVEVSEDIWDTAISLLNTLKVQSEPRPSTSKSAEKRTMREKEEQYDSSCDESNHLKPPAKKSRRDAGPPTQPSQVVSPPQIKSAYITLKIAALEGQSIKYRCYCSTSVSEVLSSAIERLKLDKAQTYRAIYEGQTIGSSDDY